MDVSEIKKLIKNSTSVLVLDNGEPSFVILDYKTYKDVVGSGEGVKEIAIKNGSSQSGITGGQNSHERETEILDRLNKEILALKDQIEMEERGLSS